MTSIDFKTLRKSLPLNWGKILESRMNPKYKKGYIYQVLGGHYRYNAEIISAAIALAQENVKMKEEQKASIGILTNSVNEMSENH